MLFVNQVEGLRLTVKTLRLIQITTASYVIISINLEIETKKPPHGGFSIYLKRY
jgi:hypothetical protein